MRNAPLYDPRFEHDACGVGFVAARDLASSHHLTRLAIDCLTRLEHRGARAADGTGDGSGILTQIPYQLFARESEIRGIRPPAPGQMGVMACFFRSADAAGLDTARAAITSGIAAEGLEAIWFRKVPIHPAVLGRRALESLPTIEHVIVGAPEGIEGLDFERRLFLARKRVERGGLAGVNVVSSSSRTVVYKGLFHASHIADFYWDLADADYETAFAVFHQRYSTNTLPSWEIAQPFRTLGHNGEINTIASNRSWTYARERVATSSAWGERLADVAPFLQPGQSDSGSLDNMFELLLLSGRSLGHVKELLVPAAWENVADLSPERRAFSEYHAFLTEPWDGPAAVAATDGISLASFVDRNGLRPARWAITPGVVLVASEAGVCPEEETRAERTGQLGPGEVLIFDRTTGEIHTSEDIKETLANQAPYENWIGTETFYVQQPFDALADDRFDAASLCRVFGYTPEERRAILAEMAEGKTPTGSMGNDTALAALAEEPRRLTQYLHQLFAQVTNPPMDPIREQLVMSLRTYMGRRASLLEESWETAHIVELSSPVLSDAELEHIVGSTDPSFFSYWIAATWRVAEGPPGMERRLRAICAEAVEAVKGGASLIVLSDREVSATEVPVPMVLAVGAVHHALIEAGVRIRASMMVVSGEPRDSHDLAMLIAAGASAVNPYLAIDQVRTLAEEGIVHVDPVLAQENYRSALQSGLLKIMSKMGICTVSAYRGSELFEVLGLSEEVCDLAFRNAPRRFRGLSLEEIASRALTLHSRYQEGEEHPGGFYKHRGGGALHITGPGVVLALQKSVRSGETSDWDKYVTAIQNRPPSTIRDLLQFVSRRPISLEQVEPADRIMRRFVVSAMSHGALSRETHEALAEAMNQIGGYSNSGEGGEGPERFNTPRNSAIKQVASGRFGVTPAYLASAEELQIKMAQGSKPGEGGQLPGHKVTAEIARLRHTEPGVTLISPPPHHDIYSIEDLAQLIYDLKAFKAGGRVSVKLVSEPGVGTVAVGVAKAQADAILISGTEGGTGASPLESVKHAGGPWELGLAEAHQVLVANGLRSQVTLETDGGLRTGRDVVLAAMLGAERFGFGTLPLLALGCKMVRQCHLNTCPVGIATQREDLRAKFTGAADHVVVLFRHLAEDVRNHLATLGVRSLAELIGRADWLEPTDHPLAAGLSSFLVRAEGRHRHPGYSKALPSRLNDRLVAEAAGVLDGGGPIELSFPINNIDRSVGTRLAGEIVRRGLDPITAGKIKVHLSGVAGQSFGAFLVDGIELRLRGTANDYVGKGLGGGLITVVPRRPNQLVPHAAGNAVLYGATGGTAFLAGAVGQRFAVRNSGAVAVVEGCSDHGCEYMTGGSAVVLGPVGRNFAAGMTGGVAYVWDPKGTLNRYVADTSPAMRRLLETEGMELNQLLSNYLAETNSPVARAILDEWFTQLGRFWVLRASKPIAAPEPPQAQGARRETRVETPVR
ncbi:MAG TPA: glutamate synthase large subunit [Acidimicrobiia bacterium]|nr:glutamate synthase large subunit [Acidimicrobiia bacterium]